MSPSQLDLLRAYEAILHEQGLPLGVVSKGDRDRLWDRHILDSLRPVACIPTGATVADLGSGGGLPGIPLAILRPDVVCHLVEARSRRASFLEMVVEALPLPNVRVLPARVERADLTVEVCLARALAPPETVWELASALLTDRGMLLYWAGRSWNAGNVQALAAVGVGTEVCAPPSVEGQGSVVKMARTVLSPDPGTR